MGIYIKGNDHNASKFMISIHKYLLYNKNPAEA